MNSRYFRLMGPVALLSVTAAFSGDTAVNYTPIISGYASFEAGEVMKGYSDAASVKLDRDWLETGYMGLCADAAVNDHLRILVAGEGQLQISFRREEEGQNDEYISLRFPQTIFTIKRGEALYTIGSADHPLFQVEAGFFPYKYNPDVNDLGEYLFRTYCYPAAIINEFDRPYADLVGFRVGNSLGAGPGYFHHDLLLTTETEFYPYEDWSLSYLADYSIPRLFSFGAGAQLFDVFSVGADNSALFIGNDPTTPDTANLQGKAYTFAGTKLMARFSFDVKGLIPADAFLADLFGKEDLKLYGEAAILGLKNYHDPDTANHDGYDSLLWRVPMMAGFNLPTFKVLDVLSFELEYQDSPYPNSITNVLYNMSPVPVAVQSHAKFKWSLYAKKTIASHVSIIGQVANDHLMPYSQPLGNDFNDLTDVTFNPGDWWWTLKMRFDF